MDFFEQIAREQVRAMILNHARREDLSQIFSQGEMRLLGCLNAGADGRTAVRPGIEAAEQAHLAL